METLIFSKKKKKKFPHFSLSILVFPATQYFFRKKNNNIEKCFRQFYLTLLFFLLKVDGKEYIFEEKEE
jgi:hypothetical protein